MDDRQEFQDMLHGLESLGTSSQEIKEVFATVAAVLWIGQIEFRQVEGKKTDVEIVDLAPVRIVANLIQCDEGALTQALMTRQYAAGNTKAIAANLSLEQAYYTRDALAKTIYFRLFDFIVGQVNKAMHISHSIGNKLDTKYPSIGVLDIYGFEIFENNSFEQFCINFVNEKLQQIFIENTLRAEQDEYKAEKIEWTPVEFFNNKIVCDLFESKPKGIFNFLDEACIIPQGDDNSFLRCLDEQFMSHPHYSKPEDKNIKMTAFTVRHYAGDVTYQNAGFVDKNKDLVWYDLLHMGESSKMSIFQMMFPYGGATRMQNSKKRPLTAGTQFKSQVASLMKHLSASTPHYIRCIKPNDNKQAGSYVDERVLHQICYLGLLENVRVRRAGFAFRQTFERFLKRYKMVCKTTWPSYHGDPKNGVELILDEMNLHGGSDYQMGVTKVFIRKPESLFELEEFRERAVNELVKKIQKVYKGWKARKYFLELREKALGIYNGKKARRRLSVKFFFVGDYINGEEDALLKEELRNQGSTKIIFADTVDKINKKNVSQQRKIILADSSLFFMKVDKKGKYQTQRQIPLSKISSFSLSPFVDNWLVIHVRDEYDYVIICERKTELLTTISEALTKFGTKLDLNISENITFKLKSKSERSIQFIEDKSISQVSWGLAKGKKNTIQVVVGDIATATRSQVADAASQVKKKKAQAETNFSKYVQRTSSHEKPVAPAVRKVQEASKEPGELYRAVAQYQTNDSEELSFEFGDIFRVLEKREDGWWVAIEVETGYKGFIPSNYVTKYE